MLLWQKVQEKGVSRRRSQNPKRYSLVVGEKKALGAAPGGAASVEVSGKAKPEAEEEAEVWEEAKREAEEEAEVWSEKGREVDLVDIVGEGAESKRC